MGHARLYDITTATRPFGAAHPVAGGAYPPGLQRPYASQEIYSTDLDFAYREQGLII